MTTIIIIIIHLVVILVIRTARIWILNVIFIFVTSSTSTNTFIVKKIINVSPASTAIHIFCSGRNTATSVVAHILITVTIRCGAAGSSATPGRGRIRVCVVVIVIVVVRTSPSATDAAVQVRTSRR